MNNLSKHSYSSLVEVIGSLLQESRAKIVRAINQDIIIRNWHIGQYIVEFEQKGEERAKYGTELLKKLSEDLTREFGKGFSYRNLRLIKQFYITFQDWGNWPTLSANSGKGIWQSLSAKSRNQIWQTPSAISKNGNNDGGESQELLIESISKLTWSHLTRLISLTNKLEREYYILESSENTWSVRELDRQINSALYERVKLSENKAEVLKQAKKGEIITQPIATLKDPMILEFLGLDESIAYTENDLETSIIDNIEKFLLELGKGFSFVARQKRISGGNENYYIDLVFYNRLMQCHVLIDLKIGKLKHQDVGQMLTYVNYYDREIKVEYEHPTIGIILCKENDEFIVKYSLPENYDQILSREYKLYLPEKEELKKVLEGVING